MLTVTVAHLSVWRQRLRSARFPACPRESAAAPQQGTPKQLLGTLHVTDKKDVPLTDVTAAELEVKENGQSRPIQTAELDTRPLAVAIVLDNNSELSTSFMQSVVPAGIALVKALPPGTHHRYLDHG
jgi:hypothetical protein